MSALAFTHDHMVGQPPMVLRWWLADPDPVAALKEESTQLTWAELPQQHALVQLGARWRALTKDSAAVALSGEAAQLAERQVRFQNVSLDHVNRLSLHLMACHSSLMLQIVLPECCVAHSSVGNIWHCHSCLSCQAMFFLAFVETS